MFQFVSGKVLHYADGCSRATNYRRFQTAENLLSGTAFTFSGTNQHPCTSYFLSSDLPRISPGANTPCRHNAFINAGLPFPGLWYNAKFAKNTQIITIWGNITFASASSDVFTFRFSPRWYLPSSENPSLFSFLCSLPPLPFGFLRHQNCSHRPVFFPA